MLKREVLPLVNIRACLVLHVFWQAKHGTLLYRMAEMWHSVSCMRILHKLRALVPSVSPSYLFVLLFSRRLFLSHLKIVRK
jgi:hypothetical protein